MVWRTSEAEPSSKSSSSAMKVVGKSPTFAARRSIARHSARPCWPGSNSQTPRNAIEPVAAGGKRDPPDTQLANDIPHSTCRAMAARKGECRAPIDYTLLAVGCVMKPSKNAASCPVSVERQNMRDVLVRPHDYHAPRSRSMPRMVKMSWPLFRSAQNIFS